MTHTSLDVDPEFMIEPKGVVRAVFWGLGSDGTVGANKNSIKIIGEETDNYAQGYFVYDSKKSGARTVSHLRFGTRPIHSTYLIQKANFIGVHQFGFLERYNILDIAAPEAVLLLNAPYPVDEVWDNLPRVVQEQIIRKQIKLYTIDAYEVANRTGMAGRINTVMQTCFFAISGVLPREEAIEQIKKSIKKTYGKRGEAVVRRNFAAVDDTVANLFEVKVPATGDQHHRDASRRARCGACLRAGCHRDDDQRRRRPAARERPARGRHLSHRHHPVGEAQYRPGSARLGFQCLYPVWQMRLRLPPRSHPRQAGRAGGPGRRT